MSTEQVDKKKEKKQKEKVDFSQMTQEEIDEYKRAKRKTWVQALKYAICTASAGLIELISFTILNEVIDPDIVHVYMGSQEIELFIPTIVALTLSILWNFTINRKFTFKSAGNVPRAMFLAFLFYVPFFPFKVWFNGTMPALMGFAGAETVAEICSMLLNGILEFCWQKFFIYRNEEDSAVEANKIGEIGPNGEITPEKQEFTGPEISAMLSAGLDINEMKDKDMHKWLKKNDF